MPNINLKQIKATLQQLANDYRGVIPPELLQQAEKRSMTKTLGFGTKRVKQKFYSEQDVRIMAALRKRQAKVRSGVHATAGTVAGLAAGIGGKGILGRKKAVTEAYIPDKTTLRKAIIAAKHRGELNTTATKEALERLALGKKSNRPLESVRAGIHPLKSRARRLPESVLAEIARDVALLEERKKLPSEVVKRPGAFRAKAQQHGMSTAQFQQTVLANPKKYDPLTVKQAGLAKAFATMRSKKK